jgi:hypothetical protein
MRDMYLNRSIATQLFKRFKRDARMHSVAEANPKAAAMQSIEQYMPLLDWNEVAAELTEMYFPISAAATVKRLEHLQLEKAAWKARVGDKHSITRP